MLSTKTNLVCGPDPGPVCLAGSLGDHDLEGWAGKAVIVIAPDASEPEQYAAKELAQFLGQITGAEFKVLTGRTSRLRASSSDRPRPSGPMSSSRPTGSGPRASSSGPSATT